MIAARRLAIRAEDRLAGAEQRLALLDPERLLARGWSITRTDEGVLVTDPAQVKPGADLQTVVAGGVIPSVVTEDGEVTDGR
jgi:exonuclease VII large subunit